MNIDKVKAVYENVDVKKALNIKTSRLPCKRQDLDIGQNYNYFENMSSVFLVTYQGNSYILKVLMNNDGFLENYQDIDICNRLNSPYVVKSERNFTPLSCKRDSFVYNYAMLQKLADSKL